MEIQSLNPPVLVECPRDAMQGMVHFIPTEQKINYLNRLLQVGFQVLDFGSFVSPRAIPQLLDTAEVLAGLDLTDTVTELLAIVLNEKGAVAALAHKEISWLGFPFSLSETFQQRNAHQSLDEAFGILARIQELCLQHDRQVCCYFSMGFGNPYGDPWSADLVLHWAERIAKLGVKVISLADTVGGAKPETITPLFALVRECYPEVTWGAHFHAHPDHWREKVNAAWLGGCRRFDGAIGGYGGCPFAADELVGNIATEHLLEFFTEMGVHLNLNKAALAEARQYSAQIFAVYS